MHVTLLVVPKDRLVVCAALVRLNLHAHGSVNLELESVEQRSGQRQLSSSRALHAGSEHSHRFILELSLALLTLSSLDALRLEVGQLALQSLQFLL